MKKGLLLFSILSLISKFLLSQVDESLKDAYTSDFKKHRIALTLGSSGPMGDFDAADSRSTTSGYANGGTSFELSYNYAIDPSISIGINWGGAGYLFDLNGYLKASSAADPSSQFYAEANPYGVGYFMLNARYQLGIKSKFYINGSLGSMSMLTPEVKVRRTSSDPNESGNIVFEESLNAALGYSIGGGVDIFISELISFNIALDYYQADFDVESIILLSPDIGGSQVVKNEYEQPYSALNFSVGIVFGF